MLTFNEKTLAQLEATPVTKGEVFADFPHTYDTALPQGWLDAFADWCKGYPGIAMSRVTYHLILSTTVWAYPKQGLCGPVTCCTEVLRAWNRYRVQTV